MNMQYHVVTFRYVFLFSNAFIKIKDIFIAIY